MYEEYDITLNSFLVDAILCSEDSFFLLRTGVAFLSQPVSPSLSPQGYPLEMTIIRGFEDQAITALKIMIANHVYNPSSQLKHHSILSRRHLYAPNLLKLHLPHHPCFTSSLHFFILPYLTLTSMGNQHALAFPSHHNYFTYHFDPTVRITKCIFWQFLLTPLFLRLSSPMSFLFI